MDLFRQKNFNKIAEKLQNGNQFAGEEIFDYFSPKIFGFFMLRTNHKETAEDLTQNVFLKVVNKINTFKKDTGNFSAWIWQIARNTLIDHFRLQKPILLSNEELEIKAGAKETDSTFEAVAQKEEAVKIFKIIQTMEPQEQELFSLRYVSNLSFKEISVLLDKSADTLRVASHRLHQKIKNKVKKDYV